MKLWQSFPQDHIRATYCKKLTKEDGYVSCTDYTAHELYNMYRAYYEFPKLRIKEYLGQFGEKCIIVSCSIPPHTPHVDVSTAFNHVLFCNKEVYVLCKNATLLQIHEIMNIHGKKIDLRGYQVAL